MGFSYLKLAGGWATRNALHPPLAIASGVVEDRGTPLQRIAEPAADVPTTHLKPERLRHSFLRSYYHTLSLVALSEGRHRRFSAFMKAQALSFHGH